MSKQLKIKQWVFTNERALICLPVVSTTAESILNDVNEYVKAGVPVIEFRADFYQDLFDESALLSLLEKLAAVCKNTVLLFTIRTSQEGGQVEISESDYKKIILLASRSGHVDLVDCEIDKISKPFDFIAQLHESGTRVIASHHNFNYTYDAKKIMEIYEKMHKAGADIAKLAMMPCSKQDTLRTLECALDFDEHHENTLVIAIAMGALGKPSRVMGGFVGSCLTFASLRQASAPGQIAYEDMRTLLNKLDY